MSEKMEKPRPSRAPAGSDRKLAELLQLFGNDRAYTIISSKGNHWKIMLEGDYTPTIIKYEGDKPVMIKEG